MPITKTTPNLETATEVNSHVIGVENGLLLYWIIRIIKKEKKEKKKKKNKQTNKQLDSPKRAP
jgi:hypothetical protein